MKLPFLLQKKHTTTRAFSYEQNGVILSFSLRTDVKTQLKPFEKLLEAALADVREELKK